MMDEQKDLDLIEQIRSVGRYAPRATFRIKVAIASVLPSYGMALAGRNSPRLGWGPRYGWTRPVKLVAASAMALLVAVVIFSGLLAASSGSLPGQTLYGLKRFREGVDLALTSSPTVKAQRYLKLASARLEELETISQKGIIDSQKTRSIARDYAAETAGAARVIEQQASGPSTQALARQLQALQTQKDNMVRRIAAASPAGVLAEAGGARVTLNGACASQQDSTTADGAGKISFTTDVTPETAAGLAARIEDDGRKAVVPVYQPAGGSRYSVTATPGDKILELNEPVTFAFKITRADGSKVGPTQARFSDPTLTSALDGQTGSVLVRTNASGTCTVTITKTSIQEVSRIMLDLVDPGWVDVGEVLRLGGVQSPSAAPARGDVTVTSTGSGASAQSLEMDNGLVKISAAPGDSGEIVTSITRAGSPALSGPLFDTLPALAGQMGRSVTTSGPRVLFSTNRVAGFETVLEMPVGDGSIKKDYKVFLSSGDRFATVESRVEVTGSAAALVDSNPALAATCSLELPAAATVGVGGRTLAKPRSPGGSVVVTFEIGNPYYSLTLGQDVTIGAFPIDSATYPPSLTLTASSIGPTAPASIPPDGVLSQTMMLGLTDKDSVEGVISRARMGIGDPSQVTTAASYQGSRGFSVVADPPLEKLTDGKQKITLRIYKQYEKVLSGFQSD